MSEAMFERLRALAARYEAGVATPDERAEWAELSVVALEATRATQAETARRMAADYFAYLAVSFGDEAAREAWGLAPPKRRPGYRVSDAKRRQDALVVLTDQTYRDLGLEPEEAAARALGNRTEQHDARRVVDRIKARSKAKP